MELLDLFVKVGLQDEASDKVDSLGSKIGSGLKTAGKVGLGAVTAVAGAVTALGASAWSSTKQVADYGDQIDKMSQKMGISAEAYQEWDFIAQHSGTSMDSLKAGFKTLANSAQNGAEEFEKLGISLEDASKMSTEDLFGAVITGLQGMEEGTERTAIASKLLGKGAVELGAVLNMSAEETEAMKDSLHDMGGVLSDEAVKASAEFQDSMQDLQVATDGLKNNLMTEFMPALSEIMQGLTAIFSGDSEEGLGKISEGVETLITKITEATPRILETATTIVTSIATAIINNLPSLFETGSQIVLQLAKYVIDNLPMLVQTALELVVSIAQGIAEALPELVPAIVEVILEIIDVLTDPKNLEMLLDASIQIIIALAEGLINALPELLLKAPEIIANLVEAIIKAVPLLIEAAVEIVMAIAQGIVDNIGKLVEKGEEIVQSVKDGFKKRIDDAKNWGKDLIQNFIDGIKEKWEALKSSVKQVADTVKDFLGFSEPKEGPLSNFHTYAPDMMKLYSEGIRENLWRVDEALNGISIGTSDTDIAPQMIHNYIEIGGKPLLDFINSGIGAEI